MTDKEFELFIKDYIPGIEGDLYFRPKGLPTLLLNIVFGILDDPDLISRKSAYGVIELLVSEGVDPSRLEDNLSYGREISPMLVAARGDKELYDLLESLEMKYIY